MDKNNVILVENIDDKIFPIRRQRVMIDADLAKLYGVSTKALNQAVKRNKARFPKDFMFVLTKKEKAELVTNCDHLKNLKYSSSLPKAFTEHGAIMLASVLNSQHAVETSIYVVRAFIRLREIMISHKELAIKLRELELKLENHDENIIALMEAINQLLAPPEPARNKIGFTVEERKIKYGKRNKNHNQL